jgi:hypothetical protein
LKNNLSIITPEGKEEDGIALQRFHPLGWVNMRAMIRSCPTIPLIFGLFWELLSIGERDAFVQKNLEEKLSSPTGLSP